VKRPEGPVAPVVARHRDRDGGDPDQREDLAGLGIERLDDFHRGASGGPATARQRSSARRSPRRLADALAADGPCGPRNTVPAGSSSSLRRGLAASRRTRRILRTSRGPGPLLRGSACRSADGIKPALAWAPFEAPCKRRSLTTLRGACDGEAAY